MKVKYVLLYDTMTYNTYFFSKKVQERDKKIFICNIKDTEKYDYLFDENTKFHLITYTIGEGLIPNSTINFIENNYPRYEIKTISSTGQKNWGKDLFAVADILNSKMDSLKNHNPKLNIDSLKVELDKFQNHTNVNKNDMIKLVYNHIESLKRHQLEMSQIKPPDELMN